MLIDLEGADTCILYAPAGNGPGEWDCCYNWLTCASDWLNFDPEQAESLSRKYVLAVLWSSGEVFTTGSYIVPQTMMESYYKLVAQVIVSVGLHRPYRGPNTHSKRARRQRFDHALCSMWAQALCGIAYAYLLGALCNIFAIKARSANKYYEDMDELNNVLAIKKIENPELSTNLRQYFRYAPPPTSLPRSSPMPLYTSDTRSRSRIS
jgi:hypothetical protein